MSTNEHQCYRIGLPSLAFVVVRWCSLTFVLAIIAPVAHGQAPPPGGTLKPADQAATTVQMQATPPPEIAGRVHFFGNRSFTEKDLRDAVADPLQQIRNEGLSLPLADDTAYYVGLFYRRHGYPVVDVKYKISVLQLGRHLFQGGQHLSS